MAYWLFKTEPDEFSIDDLESLSPKAEPWDGIRNYQARNLLRDDVQVGDKVFIYHSSCKHVGIAGIAEVVNAAYADPAQFDAKHKYYDAKANETEPRWYCVDVVFVSRFSQLVPLKLLKQHEALQNMVLLKQGRLSIQQVSNDEWQYITQLAKELS